VELLRSLLFVPADSPRKLAKARTLRPDAFVFDLEDAVAPDKKQQARAWLEAELGSLAGSPSKIIVRVNRIGSEFFDADMRVAVHPAVDGLLLPKCDDPADLVRTHGKMGIMESKKGIRNGKIEFLLILETALGVVCAYDLARACSRIVALNFGAEDYCADMGISRTPAGDEVAVPRMLVSQAAHAARLQAIDSVFTDFHDEAGLIADTRRAMQMGYTGKAAIHPNQIEPIHRAFAPTEDQVAWAKEVVQAFEEAKTRGAGVVSVRGKMVDEPVMLQARKILQQHDAGASGKPIGS
jgi:citrate lyase subunit beta/citryl-CoA lyase